MIVIAKDLEIRGHEVKKSAKTGNEYIIVRVEDTTGKAHEIIDRDMENAAYYTRGTRADFYLDLQMGKYTNVSVSRFEIIKQ